MLAGLSLLQVVVATLFSQGIFFGVLLAVHAAGLFGHDVADDVSYLDP